MFKDMEVTKLMAHLIITLALVLGYIALILVKGTADATIQGALLLAIGYWFGAVQLNQSKGNSSQGAPQGNDPNAKQ